MDFNLWVVAGIPLVFVIFGLVEMFKSFGLKGWVLTLLSLAIGLVLGICYQLAQTGMPVDFSGWFTVVIIGLALGLVASGFYKFVDSRFPVREG